MKYLIIAVLSLVAGVAYSKIKNDPIIKAACDFTLPSNVKIEYSKEHAAYLVSIQRESKMFLADYGSAGFSEHYYVYSYSKFDDSCSAKARWLEYKNSGGFKP